MECHELESRLADEMAGELTPERAEGLMEHVETCAACRAEYQDYQIQEERLERYFRGHFETAVERSAAWRAEFQAPPVPARSRGLGWLAAAAALLIAVVGAVTLVRPAIPMGAGPVARMESLQGRAMVFDGDRMLPVSADATIGRDQRIKVAGGGHLALELTSGATIEARGGTQFRLREYPSRVELELNRGQVLVRAGAGEKPVVVRTEHFRVEPNDGIAAIEDGIDRSVVTVAKGAAEVRAGRRLVQLAAGQSFSTRAEGPTIAAAMAPYWRVERGGDRPPPIPVGEGDFPPLRVEPAKRLERTDAVAPVEQIGAARDLVEFLPDGTVLLVDIKDWRGLLDELRSSAYAELGEAPGFREWLESTGLPELQERLRGDWRLNQLNEISRELDGQLVAAVDDGEGFVLIAECGANEDSIRRRLDELVRATPKLGGCAVVAGGRLILSNAPERVIETMSRLIDGRPTSFTQSAFYQRIERDAINPRYRIAVNLARLLGEARGKDRQAAELLGLDRMDYLLVSPSFHGRGIRQAARLGFTQTRSGVMNWLAEPGPMRGIDFFSPETHLFASALLRSPRLMVMDMLVELRARGMEREYAELWRLYDEHADLFDSIGGEVAIGLDSPILPIPNFKIVVEILDPSGFEAALDALLEDVARRSGSRGEIARRTIEYRGRRVHSLQIAGAKFQPSFAVVEDYLILGPGPEFVTDAIDIRDSGRSIARAPELLDLLPADADAHVSALVYQNLGGAVRDLTGAGGIDLNLPAQLGFLTEENWLERYGAPGIVFASARPRHIDLYFSTEQGIDFNLALAAPLLAGWLLPKIAKGEVPPPAPRLEELAARTYNSGAGESRGELRRDSSLARARR